MAVPSEPADLHGASSLHAEPDSLVQPISSSETQEHKEIKGGGEDQALESHEVIELQTFSERKAWIEDKIKFLESLPPIDVFHGLDYIRASAEEVPGLPTREELQIMVTEHDVIEKETEIFDTGELTKLRQLTKAATQRNLSPADTDLIELTLTTIYELDKLLHLLRDRSDNLEMMAIRLTWEENRRAGWKERCQIIGDLNSFAVNRARWSPSIYDLPQKNEESSEAPTRRGSIASLASTGSSDSVINSPAFSRSARFKLAELLSRDAAQFTGRVTSLKHGTVSSAGKALDRLIDRKTVPEALLDEQDRLEEKCIGELENIGKFTLSLVMQWRKADEIYVETMKDHSSASNLLDEIETAQIDHPTARQSNSFISRIDTILKRLSVRGDPASPVCLFPRPEHHLFPDQKEANVALVQRLSADISVANMLARKVEVAAKAYRSRYEAVKNTESLLRSINDQFATLTIVTKKYCEGISSDDGDGSPPDLTSEDSLEPMSHNVFLALFPSLLEETNLAVENTDILLRSAPSVLLALDLPGIEDHFKENTIASVRRLSSLRGEAVRLRDSVMQQVVRLRESRKIAYSIDHKLSILKTVRTEIARGMELHRWHQESGGTGAPPTPESPLAELHGPNAILFSFDDQLAKVKSSLLLDIEEPLDKLSADLEPQLHFVLKQRFSNLQFAIDASHQMLRLLGSIKEQTLAMNSVRDGFQKLSSQIEDANIHCSNLIQVPVSHSPDWSDDFGVENLELIQREVASFIDGLPDQVPFIARQSRLNKRTSLISPISPILNGLVDIWTEIPFDLASVDAAVRADSNMYSMRLSGDLDSLLQTKTHLDLTKLANQLDEALSMTLLDINTVAQQLSAHQVTFTNLQRHSPESVTTLQVLLDGLNSSKARRPSIARSLSPIRDLLRQMEDISRPFSPSIREQLYRSRVNSVDDTEIRLNSWYDQVEVLKQEVSFALEDEHRYREERRLAEERKKKAEEERIAAEEAERLRLEKERLEAAERHRRLDEQRAEEKRQEEQRKRLAIELAEKERLAREAAEAERLRLEEEAKLEGAARLKFEEERLAREVEEKVHREQERQAMLEKLRLTEEELDQERKVHAQDTKIAKEVAEKQKKEMEKLARRQVELEKAAQERFAKEQVGKHEKENKERLEQHRVQQERDRAERAAKKGKGKEIRLEPIPQDSDDVFIVQKAFSQTGPSLPQVILDLQGRIIQLRRRLKSICMTDAIRPSKTSTELPTEEQTESIVQNFTEIFDITQTLPSKVDDAATYHELQCLRNELEESSKLLEDLQRLVLMQQAVQACDGALSDLLEHIDSYPAPPLGLLSSSHKSQPGAPPEEQLSARLAFTRKTVSNVTSKLKVVSRDPRATAENDRIQQTWNELNEMAIDRLVGKKSRSPSVSSGRSSSASSSQPVQTRAHGRKAGCYSNLSVSSVILPPRPKMLAPPPLHLPRRAVSGSRDTPSRSASRLSTVTNRSVSGPMRASLHEPTFASRQRTTSLSNSTSTTPLRSPVALAPAIRLRTDSATKRNDSPAMPDYQRSQSRTFNRTAQTPSRSSMNSSTWSRAPRNSLSSIMQRNITPKKKPAQPPPKKEYIADPKSKLDVAVGDVLNKLSVGINVEGVTESWRDQSGKYWIGNEEPKLCFCRILRSQTVMVRVGGGWTELSKFINNHFADSFRLLPESPPRPGSREPKWISSTTLIESLEDTTPPAAPRTPEPSIPFVPTFSLMTPSGHSPRSIKSSPSTKGSPLTPLQFMRRAEPDFSISMLRPITPSKSPHRNRMPSNPNTPVWRP